MNSCFYNALNLIRFFIALKQFSLNNFAFFIKEEPFGDVVMCKVSNDFGIIFYN